MHHLLMTKDNHVYELVFDVCFLFPQNNNGLV